MRLDVKPRNWEDRLVLFAGHLAGEKRQSSTIRSYISAIKAILVDEKVEINENKCLLNAITRGCRLTSDRVVVRLPIHKQLLHILLIKLTTMFDQQPYLSKLYKAMFAIAYYGLFRIGEIANRSHPILAKDVHLASNKKKLMIILHTSKTHWKNNKPQIIKISAVSMKKNTGQVTDKEFCPYQLLRSYIDIRESSYKTNNEPFFIFRDRSGVSPILFRKILKQTLMKNNITAEAFSGHIFRIGWASDLMIMGVPIETIKKLGRWKTNCVYTYLQ